MNYNLVSILQQLAAIHFTEIEGSFTSQELWEWMLFDQENSFLNQTLEIHQPSGVPIKGRTIELDNTVIITGEYYCFTYIDHQPAYHLQKMKSSDELANVILAKSGINNSFTTVMIPIIKGKPKPISAKNDFTAKAINLIIEIQQIISFFNGVNFNELTKQGHACLIAYKNIGVSQQEAYGAMHFISQIYQTLDIEKKNDLLDEFLDYICGYIGNKKYWIWNNRL